MKRIHILRPGTFAAHSGGEVTLTAADLADVAASYSAAKHEAPIVVGHPTLNAPAFGWVGGLEADAQGNVFAVPREVNADFAELVRGGAYKKVSASLFPPKHAGNPTPGKWSLRHVGFLGAMPPAIKGLASIEFAGGDAGTVSIELAEWQTSSALADAARLFRRLRDWFIGEKDLATADQILPDWAISSIDEAARASRPAQEALPAFAEGAAAEPSPAPRSNTPLPDPLPLAGEGDQSQQESPVDAEKMKELANREAALAAREQAIKTQEAELATAAAKTHREAITSFAEGLVQEGRLLPAHKATVVELCTALDATQVVEFGEGDAKTSSTRLDAFKGLLKAAPVVVPLGEHAKAAADAGTADFAAPAGSTVHVERLELHQKVQAHAAQHNTSYEAALAAVTKG